MDLTPEQHRILDGDYGKATRKAMQILVTLGEIYGAKRLVPVSSVQVAGVSYDNLGEAGLHFLSEMADSGGQARQSNANGAMCSNGRVASKERPCAR